ncbi:lipocalin-like domain-containing protein [Gemmatimonadota bacterium]
MKSIVAIISLLLFAASFTFLAAAKREPNASGAQAQFVGTWELASIERRSEDGDWVQTSLALCGTPVGILMYDDKGSMAVQITISPRNTECPSDRPNWVNGYTAYYGNNEVDPEAATITHHRRNHINAAVGDLSVVRHFQFEGDMLTLTIAPERQARFNWVRVTLTGGRHAIPSAGE